jgi:universal stress protein E
LEAGPRRGKLGRVPTFRRVLVDIDPLAARHPALDRALDLASRCHAHVTIVDVLPEVPGRAREFVTETIERELVANRRAALATVAVPPGVTVETKVLRGRPAEALVHEVLVRGHDLVVRAHIRDLGGAAKPFGAVDMELLRQCPCPVWLVGPTGRSHPRRILAAVHANPDDPVEQRLNGRILDLALDLAHDEHARLTVLQAWEAFGESTIRGYMSRADAARFVAEAHRVASDDFGAFVTTFGDRLGGCVLALEKGEPQDVVPDYAVAHGVDLVVMGTVARTGIAGLVMGNTAERVLQRLRGSVLAVKPEGFRSPLEGR